MKVLNLVPNCHECGNPRNVSEVVSTFKDKVFVLGVYHYCPYCRTDDWAYFSLDKLVLTTALQASNISVDEETQILQDLEERGKPN